MLFTVCRVQSTVRCSLGKSVNEGRVAESVKEGILFVPQAVSGFQAPAALRPKEPSLSMSAAGGSDEHDAKARRRLVAAALALDADADDASRGSGSGDTHASASFSSFASMGIKLRRQPSNVNVNLEETLAKLVEHQITGLVRAKKLLPADYMGVCDRLKAAGFSPYDVQEKVRQELVWALNARHDCPMAESTREGGWGWSHQHVRDHMSRFLASAVGRMMGILRGEDAALQPPASTFLQTARFVQHRTKAAIAIGACDGGEGDESEGEPADTDFCNWGEQAPAAHASASATANTQKPLSNIAACMKGLRYD